MFIPCSHNCIHQSEGCCRLDRASAVTGEDSRICPHYQDYPDEIRLPSSDRFNPREPQRLL